MPVTQAKPLKWGFWHKVGSVAACYILIQFSVLLSSSPGWLKFWVISVDENWQYWDGGIYAQLSLVPHCTAFYPLWPMLIGWVSHLFTHSVTLSEAMRTANVLSEVIFLSTLPIALFTFQRIIKNNAIAFLCLVLYATGPNAVFFSIGYSESLFNLLSFGFLIVLSYLEEQTEQKKVRNRLFSTLACGLIFTMSILAGVTRPVLIQSVIAIAFVLLISYLKFIPRQLSGVSRAFRQGSLNPQVAKIAIIIGLSNIVGYALYGNFCWQTVADFFAPFQAQVQWGRSLAFRPWLLLLPRSLLIDLYGLYLPGLLLITLFWVLSHQPHSSNSWPVRLPRSPWVYILLIHPLIFSVTWLALRCRFPRFAKIISVNPHFNWQAYLKRFSVLYAIAFSGVHSFINFWANSGNLYSTSRHVFATPFVFIGIGSILTVLSVAELNRLSWAIAAIGVGLLAHQWLSYTAGGWLG